MKIHIIPVLQDNYSYLLESGGEAAVIDPGEAAPVIKMLEAKKLKLAYILNTHHHGDHIGGNNELKGRFGAKLAAPDDDRIHGIDIKLNESSVFVFGGLRMQILETPGHTRSHICLYWPELKALFTGDTLFSMGCGRLFEGIPAQMWDSLQKIMALPDDTQIYCGHEYTLSNGYFCLDREPQNKDLQNRVKEAETLREENLPTLPVSLGIEKRTNAFLRAGSAEKFSELRELKNAA